VDQQFTTLPRQLQPTIQGTVVKTDATPTTIVACWSGTPPARLVHTFPTQLPIAETETVAALLGLIWTDYAFQSPKAITSYIDSTTVNHVLSSGKGKTIRRSWRLIYLYVQWFTIKRGRGHTLVVRSVPTAEHSAEPLSRGMRVSARS
jgi:hypothetical protein